MLNFEKLKDGKQLNGLALAYMGDAIFEVYVRHHLLQTGATKPNEPHKRASKIVSAKSQAPILFTLQQSKAFSLKQKKRC